MQKLTHTLSLTHTYTQHAQTHTRAHANTHTHPEAQTYIIIHILWKMNSHTHISSSIHTCTQTLMGTNEYSGIELPYTQCNRLQERLSWSLMHTTGHYHCNNPTPLQLRIATTNCYSLTTFLVGVSRRGTREEGSINQRCRRKITCVESGRQLRWGRQV